MNKLGAGTRHGSLEWPAQLVPEMTADQYPHSLTQSSSLLQGKYFYHPLVMTGQIQTQKQVVGQQAFQSSFEVGSQEEWVPLQEMQKGKLKGPEFYRKQFGPEKQPLAWKYKGLYTYTFNPLPINNAKQICVAAAMYC